MTKEQIEEQQEQGQLVFEIAVQSSGPWPESCSGVRPVLSAVQKCLEAAAQGQQEAFRDAKGDVEDALYDWQVELFGVKP